MKMIDKHYGAWIGKRGFTKLAASYRKAGGKGKRDVKASIEYALIA
jgi:hypothetical protein